MTDDNETTATWRKHIETAIQPDKETFRILRMIRELKRQSYLPQDPRLEIRKVTTMYPPSTTMHRQLFYICNNEPHSYSMKVTLLANLSEGSD